MAQIRQRQVKVQVTSADPSDKVFKGIYADSSYETLLTTSKTYDFKLNAGQTEELYIRYSQKPVTITFKSNPSVIYQVTGSFGTVTVGALTDVVKTIEFPTDTTPNLTIGFTSATLNGSQWKISAAKVNGDTITLPYSMENVTPGSNITFEIEVISATTTTTTTTSTTTSTTPAPATLLFKRITDPNDYTSIAYTATYNGNKTVSVNGSDVSEIIRIPSGGRASVTINSVTSNSSLWSINQVKIGSEFKTLPYTFDMVPNGLIEIKPVFVSATTTTSTTTTTTVAPAMLKLKSNVDGTVVEIASDGIDTKKASLSLENSTYVEVDMRNAPLVDA